MSEKKMILRAKLIIFIVLLTTAWGIACWFKEILDIQAKRAIVNLKNCPCLMEVQK